MGEKLVRESSRVKSSYDFELSINRENEVVYDYTYPKDRKLNGIVFIIPGFGADTNSDYAQKLRDHIAHKFGVIAVSTIYHCFYSRPENGAKLFLDESDEKLLIEKLKHFSISSITNKIQEILFDLDSKIQILKDNGKVAQNIKVVQPMTLVPKNDEYQNFGVMQALDHVNVLKDIKQKNFDFIDNYPTILMGSSHGGYVANLVAKITPSLIDCVIDNSSYIKPPLNFIIGKENNFLDPEYVNTYGDNVLAHCFTKTKWSKDENSFYHFSKDRYEIRDLSNKNHNELIAKKSNSKIKYISYHSTKDTIAPYKDKEEFYKELNNLGFDAELKTISDSDQIDGRFIKSLKHGLDMSLKELANVELPNALNVKHSHNNSEIEPISYECDSVKYNFEEINGVYSATLSPIKNIEEAVVDRFEKNMKYFENDQPELYAKLASFDSAIEQDLYQNRYDLVFNNNNFDVKEFETGNYLYGCNSKKYAYEVGEKLKNKIDKFIFFGIGLGVHLENILKNSEAKNCLIIEDDLELFKLSTFVTPYYKLAKSSDLYFSVFDDEESFSKTAKLFFEDIKDGKKDLNSFEMNNNYKNKVLQLSNVVSELAN